NTTPSTNEETPIVININHLIVTDPDDPFPTNFTLNVKPGTNYTAAGTTVTPDPDVVDPISVVVSVTDPNGAESNNYNFQVTINPVNDPPVIIGQVAASVNEDNNFTIVPGHLTIEDPDNNSGFTVNAGAGTNYTVTGAATIVPAANYYGTLTIPITVSDGTSPSTPFNFMLTVNPVNDAPVITGHQPINIDEAEPFELLVSQITIV